MTSPSDRIRGLVREGKISAEEGSRLLGSVEPSRRATGPSLLWDPFERFGGGTAVAVGVLAVVTSIGVSRLGIRFDGAFDTHLAPGPVPWSTALADQLVAWLLPALGFWAVARSFGRGSRLLDHLGMMSMVRVALVAFAIATFPLAKHAGRDFGSPAFVVLIVLSLGFIVWLAALVFFGFRSASGLRGKRLGVALAISVVAVEVASKIVLHRLGV